MRTKKGFTLIEMLVVIAIIAILVAVIVPTVSSATKRAKAATDAANLRAVYGQANSLISSGDLDETALSQINNTVKCASFPDADMYITYSYPGFVYIFFYDSVNFYDIDYFSDVASKGSSDRATDGTNLPSSVDLKWYNITAGEWSDVFA